MNHEELRELIAAFAFDALEPDEERVVLEHLETCAECQDLLADSRAVAALLAEDIPQELQVEIAAEYATTDLRSRIVAAAEAEPRAAAPARAEASPAVPTLESRRARRALVRSRVLVGAVAAAIAVAIAVPVTLANSGGSNGSNAQTQLAQALLQPGAREVTLTGTSGATAKAVVSTKGVVFFADGLRANDTGNQTYVLWAGNAAGVQPIATFDARTGKTVQVAALTLPFAADDVALVAVSIEPGRSAPKAPTSIVLAGKPA
jgi:hypothetical protein